VRERSRRRSSVGGGRGGRGGSSDRRRALAREEILSGGSDTDVAVAGSVRGDRDDSRRRARRDRDDIITSDTNPLSGTDVDEPSSCLASSSSHSHHHHPQASFPHPLSNLPSIAWSLVTNDPPALRGAAYRWLEDWARDRRTLRALRALSTVPSVWGGLGLGWRVLVGVVERRVRGVGHAGVGGDGGRMMGKEEGSLEECALAVVWVRLSLLLSSSSSSSSSSFTRMVHNPSAQF
jgi:hypothetical protein